MGPRDARRWPPCCKGASKGAGAGETSYDDLQRHSHRLLLLRCRYARTPAGCQQKPARAHPRCPPKTTVSAPASSSPAKRVDWSHSRNPGCKFCRTRAGEMLALAGGGSIVRGRRTAAGPANLPQPARPIPHPTSPIDRDETGIVGVPMARRRPPNHRPPPRDRPPRALPPVDARPPSRSASGRLPAAGEASGRRPEATASFVGARGAQAAGRPP